MAGIKSKKTGSNTTKLLFPHPDSQKDKHGEEANGDDNPERHRGADRCITVHTKR